MEKTTKNILIAFLLNLFFSLVELFGSFVTGSIAIFSDSFHDLADALSIGLSYLFEKKSKQKPDNLYTYGYLRFSVMGSVITTGILLMGSLLVILEAIKRIINPVLPNYQGMFVLAGFGIVVNFLAMYLTKDGDSLNQKAVNLHMLEDVLGWIVVLIGSIIIKFTHGAFIDPLLSIVVALFILKAAGENMKKIIDLFLEKIPPNIDLKEIKRILVNISGVKDIHHVHIRSIDGFNIYITLHVVVNKYSKEIKDKVKSELLKMGINHWTIEMELANEECNNKKCKI